jgi:3,4-dihydroxy 2-butanone 4-phosphate synthase/GTP cyclohydrolase II
MKAGMPLQLDRFFKDAPRHLEDTGKPLVTLSYAQSLDGSIAARHGKPLGISSPESLKLTHQIRAESDAILIGIETVLSDNPQLNVRRVNGADPRPVILDTSLRFPTTARLLGEPPHPWIFTVEGASEERKHRLEGVGADVIRIPADQDGRVDLQEVLFFLGSVGFRTLMVEGGARVITAFLKQNLADQAIITISPTIIGGVRGVQSLLGTIPHLVGARFSRLGPDFIIWGRFSYDA